MRTREFLSSLMIQAWQFVKRNGFTMAQAMKVAWANAKLTMLMRLAIVKFYFLKVDGSIREAYGTLSSKLVPATKGDDKKKSDTLQVYYDTEKGEWRSFKKANLLKIA